MIRRLIKDKRGIAEEIADTAFALLVLFIAIALMTYISSLNKVNRAASSASFINQAVFENSIGVYLKMPVSVDGQEMSMADLIILAADTNSKTYKDLWKQKTDAFFNDMQGKLKISALDVTIYSADKKIKDTRFGGSIHTYDKESYTSIIYLPSSSGKTVKLEVIRRITAFKSYVNDPALK